MRHISNEQPSERDARSGRKLAMSFAVAVSTTCFTLNVAPTYSETKNTQCLSAEQILNINDLHDATACDLPGRLFIAYNVSLDPPELDFNHTLYAYEAGLATFQALRRELDVERKTGVSIKSDLQIIVLLDLLRYSMRHDLGDSIANSVKLLAIKSLLYESVSDDVIKLASSIRATYASTDAISAEEPVDALCYWANEIPGLNAGTIMQSSRYVNCKEDNTYGNIKH